MVKGFSEQEKQVILDKLHKEGKKLFSQFGLQKTSISQLTKAAGIAQGSFYLFYQSKEELYFDLLEQEEAEIQATLFPLLLGEMTTNNYKEILLLGLKQIEERPFFRSMIAGDDMEVLMRKLPPERIDAHINKDESSFLPLIKKWQQEGVMRQVNPEAIVGTLRAFILVILHKKEIGDDIYPETVELLAECIAEGLIVSKGE